jgi:hypothetical protein
MLIVCDGKRYCIGSDKIGHFFQQGHMGYEIDIAMGVTAFPLVAAR